MKKNDKNGRQPKSNQRRRKGQAVGRGLFSRFDRDKDGDVTRDESPERLKSNFDRIDTNGDGKLTRAEFEAALKRREQKPKGK